MFTLALKGDPKNADFWYHRGFVLAKIKGQAGKAVNDFSEAIKLAPNFSWAYYQRGLAFENAGKVLDAQDDYEKAMKLNPKAHG
jgi:tetratricopeptide (TPR) repeat protein